MIDYIPGGNYTANANVMLYAIWQVETQTVTFNDNGGSGGPGQVVYGIGVPRIVPIQEPSRNGYTFKGWSYYSSNNPIPGDYLQPLGTFFSASSSSTIMYYAVIRSPDEKTV